MLKIVIPLGIVLLAQASCPTRHAFDNDISCKFYMNYVDSSCYDFNFVKCSAYQCIEWDGDDCQKSRRYNFTSWQTCTEKCCDSSVTYATNSDSLTACEEYIDSQSGKFVMGLSIGLTVGVLVLIVTCCVACYCHRKRIQRINQRRMAIQRHHSMAPLDVTRVNPPMNFSNVVWKTQTGSSEKFHNVCSVCLDDKPSLQLQCGHIYHRKCIITCLKRKFQCILCRSTQIHNIQVYCQTCFQRYFDTNLMNNMDQLLANTPKCNHCRDENAMAPESIEKDFDL